MVSNQAHLSLRHTVRSVKIIVCTTLRMTCKTAGRLIPRVTCQPNSLVSATEVVQTQNPKLRGCQTNNRLKPFSLREIQRRLQASSVSLFIILKGGDGVNFYNLFLVTKRQLVVLLISLSFVAAAETDQKNESPCLGVPACWRARTPRARAFCARAHAF